MGSVDPVPITRPNVQLDGLVSVSYLKTRLADMVLDDDIRERLDRVVLEYRRGDTLQSFGLTPRRKLLLVGPPGCGKTMTASALAGELGLPLMFVELQSLITRYMGETAAKLQLVFDGMKQSRGVYLFDEFDAIGACRTGSNDVGEIRRVLNSFLQFMERDQSDSLIVAATNLHDVLDAALFRRFDDIIEYGLPSSGMICDVVRNRLSMFDLDGIGWTQIEMSATGLSHAEIVRACEDAAKVSVLDNALTVNTEQLVKALEQRQD